MTVLMFPGQGSQVKGMGADLFAKFPTEVQMANDILGYSIEALCLNDSQNRFSNTAYTQPALFVVEALSFQVKKAEGIKPSYCIGHSLGEYAALYAAGAFDFATGLKLVKKRGELMSQAPAGKMLAVLNLPVERIQSLLSANNITSIDVANLNSKNQIVLSGPEGDIVKANEILSKEAMMCIPINTSGAFHSRYMEGAAKEFEQFINTVEISPLQIPVIANVTAQLYTDSTIKEYLVKQIVSPVRWSETMSYLKNKGESEFIEVGPGTVLTRLATQN